MVEHISDRVAVMYVGKLVEVAATDDLFLRPLHPYTEALLSVVPDIQHLEPVVLRGEIPDPTRIPAGCRFHPRCPAYADGRSEAAGVAEACHGVPLAVLPAHPGHHVACHLDAALHPGG